MKKFLIIFFFGGGFQTSLSFNSIFQERFEASMYTLDVQNGVKKRNLKEMAHSQFSKLIPHCIDNNLCISTEIKAYQPRGSPVSFYSEKKCSHCLSLSLSLAGSTGCRGPVWALSKFQSPSVTPELGTVLSLSRDYLDDTIQIC